MKKKAEIQLSDSFSYSKLIRFVMPSVIMMIFTSIYSIVDGFFVSNFVNKTAFTAVNLVMPLLMILGAVGFMIGTGGVAIVARTLGLGDKEMANRYFSFLTYFTIISGVILAIVGIIFARPVAIFLGAEGEVLKEALTYVRVRSFEMVFTFFFAAFQSIRQSRGDTLTPVIYSTIGIFVNVTLNWLFIYVWGWGVFGAAFATVISIAVRAPFCFYHLFIEKTEARLSFSDLKPDFAYIKELVRVAIPSAAAQAFTSLGFLILNSAVLSYGSQVSVAFSLGNKLTNLLLMPIMAFGSVLTTFAGQNIGNDNPTRALQAYRCCRNLSLAIAIVGGVILFPFRAQAMALLSNDGEAVRIGTEYAAFVVFAQPLMGIFQSYISLFNGAGKTNYSFMMSTARLWGLRLPMIWLFRHFTDLGRFGIWWAVLLSLVFVDLFGMFLFKKVDLTKSLAKK